MQKRRTKGQSQWKIQWDCNGKHICRREASLLRRRRRKRMSTASEITCAAFQQRHTVRGIIRIVAALPWRRYGFRSRFVWGPMEKIETCSLLMSSWGLQSNPDHRFDLTDPALNVSPHRHANKLIVRQTAMWWLITGNFSSLLTHCAYRSCTVTWFEMEKLHVNDQTRALMTVCCELLVERNV